MRSQTRNQRFISELRTSVITRGAERNDACNWAIVPNVSTEKRISTAKKALADQGALTYSQLLERFCATFPASRKAGVKSPQVRNARVGVGAWLRCVGLDLDSPVGPEFAAEYPTKLAQFERSELARGIGRATLRDRRYLLGRMRKHFLRLRTSDLPESFAGALDTLLAKSPRTARDLSATIGVSAELLSLWRRGKATPSSRRSNLAVLERALDAEPGALVSRLPRSVAPISERCPEPATTGFRERMQHLVTLAPYRLTYHDTSFQEEWSQLLSYKTAELPVLKRQPQARWRAKAHMLARNQKPEWSHTLPDGRRIPSAFKWFTNLSHYLGWLTLPVAQGGKGFAIAEVQTLAWVAHPELVLGFLRWLSARSGGVNGHTLGFLDTVTSLVHPKTGYLTQRPEFCLRLPQAHRPSGDWSTHCATAFWTLKEARKVLQSSAVQTRDPEEAIARLLALRNPIKPIVDMLHTMERAMPPSTAPLRRAEHQRDMLLVAMLLSNPLRISHFIFMRQDRGLWFNLYQTSEGVWHLRYPYSAFKNGDSLSKRKKGSARSASPYDVEVAPFVTPHLERYLTEGRPALLKGKDCPFVFVGQKDNPKEPLNSLDVRLQDITSRFLPNCPGFRAQAMRHLVATAWLKSHPGDYVRVAHMLNDSLETVLRVYGHLETRETLADWGEWLSAVDTEQKRP